MDSDGDGEIDLHEFERAIRRFRRATNSKAVAKEKEGRAIAQRLLQKLQERVIPMFLMVEEVQIRFKLRLDLMYLPQMLLLPISRQF